MIDDNQIQYFNTFGFLILRNLFTASELETIRAEFEHRSQIASSYDPFDGTKKHNMLMMDDETPFLSSLMEDDRFAGTAERLFGEVIGAFVDGDRHVGDSVWHYDAGGYDAGGVKFATYLQPLRADSGALRVIPGSHQRLWHDELNELEPTGPRWSREAATPAEKALAVAAIDKIPAYVCETDPGDVIAFDLRTFHASSGGDHDRHMCSITFYIYPRTPEEIELMVPQARGWMRERDNTKQPWNPKSLVDSWACDLKDCPRRKLWFERMQHFSKLREGQNGVRAVAVNGKLKIVPVEATHEIEIR